MPGVTKEQIERAKEWDLLSYLQTYEPHEVKRCGGAEYRTVTHDSLKISNGKWHWHSRGIGGRTALDYLIKVKGMGFVAAVETLCGEPGAVVVGAFKRRQEENIQKPFSLPEKNRCGRAMVFYLQGRGIDADIISQCIGSGSLYESRKYHNCVFVGSDLAGKARYAFLRGTYGQFKKDVDGSDKQYGFYLPAADRGSPFLAVAESPVDALSIATILKRQGEDWQRNHYLALGGTAPRALIRFLHDHPAVTCISLCLDNDKAGLVGMGKIREAIRQDPVLWGRIQKIVDNPPPVSCGKDYNELLQGQEAIRTGSRQQAKKQGQRHKGIEM